MLPVTEPEAIGKWLRRLTGRFTYDGIIGNCPDCTAIKGSSECIAIGHGPGVQCILNVTWIDEYPCREGQDCVRVSYLDPAMELFGIDPGKSAISHLVVNNKGMPEGSLGLIKGDMATFKARCVNTSVGCYRVVKIEARSDSDLLWMWFGKVDNEHSDSVDYYATMSLRRLLGQPAQAD